MNLKDLRYFMAVAEHGQFGKAAAACYVSQPTLSGQIKKLETELGVTLFERNNKHVHLTQVGEKILNHSKTILGEVHHIKEIATHHADPLAGEFRIGAFPTLAPYFFPSLLSKLPKALPNLKPVLIEEKTDELIKRLHSGSLDAAFLALPIQSDYLCSEILFEDLFYLAVPSDHTLSNQQSIQLENIREEPLMLLEDGHCLRDQALAVCEHNTLQASTCYKATSLETLRQLVKANQGVTLIPEIAKQADTDIRYIPFEVPQKRTIGLVWRKTSARMPVVDALIHQTKTLS